MRAEPTGKQLLASPNALFCAAVLMFVLAIIPGMPWLPFLSFAVVLAFVGWRISQRTPGEADDAELKKLETALFSTKEEPLGWDNIGYVDPLSVSIGFQLAQMIDKSQGAPLTRRLEGLRRSMSNASGFLLPAVSVRDDLGLKPARTCIPTS
ncbi:FHIPEP family type III secretion protein [Trinickia terrae]|uniref:FHIPEP family type III secretion protein n=1 Tax=Trinickia terrae TaxID=2571161 RepID=UPI001F11207F|nr:FHIPEP family type III secretion protein [Trinickia terrae]